jgi:hypothetical protein
METEGIIGHVKSGAFRRLYGGTPDETARLTTISPQEAISPEAQEIRLEDWKIEAEHLKPLWMEAHALVREFADIKISWVARRENAEADALAGRALKAERRR